MSDEVVTSTGGSKRMIESFKLVRPDGSSQLLGSMPQCRDDALHAVSCASIGSGRYSFVRSLADPDCGELDIDEISVTEYRCRESGIIGLAGSAVIAVPRDIELYLQTVAGSVSEQAARLSLDVYEDASEFERNNVWLCVENASGNRIVEFALEVRDRLVLEDTSESSLASVFVCGLPSFRSVFRFVSIACLFFRCQEVRVRSCPLNSESGDWFS